MDDNTAAAAVLVPIFGMLVLVGLPICAFIYFRVLAHRERMEMIRNGFAPSDRDAVKRGYAPGRPQTQAVASMPCEPSATLRKGIVLLFIGIALTIGLSFIGYHEGEIIKTAGLDYREGAHIEFGPWLLGGLIPLFIGLAQVTIALLSDPSILHRFRGPAASIPPPPFYGDPPRADSSPGDGPYTYRPGPTQELRPPTAPPERRGRT